MNLKKLAEKAKDKRQFTDLKSYVSFCSEFLSYISENLQATIISQNENNYLFYQYRKEGNFQITRPINSNLMYNAKTFNKASKEFLKALKDIKNIDKKDVAVRNILNNTTYTIQQSIGSALDALPGQSNVARKLNGDLFEHFIRLILREIGISAASGVVKIPIPYEGKHDFKMSYQHDLIVEIEGDLKLLGSIKTSSKDRLGKIFLDKFLYNQLTSTHTPHVAIFLNDVQRKKSIKENTYGVNATFLPGHFIGYTLALNPLDGVYYCDIRPLMKTEPILKDHIKTFDNLLIEDIWKFI